MKVLLKREKLPIVKPFGEVTVELLAAPKAVQREIVLKDGTVKKIEDYSVVVRPLLGKFESVVEKEVTKTEDGDEIVRPKKYDAVQLGDKVLLKLTGRAYEVLYNAWQNKEIAEGTRLKIKTTRKGNKTYFDEITVIEDGEKAAGEGAEEAEETEEAPKPAQPQAKPAQAQAQPQAKPTQGQGQAKPKLKA
jgi:hypothetical protein